MSKLLKCADTMIGTRHSTENSQEMNIYIDGNKIKNVTKQKLLGIYIDENLQWSDHIDYLCSTISSKISLLKQLSLYIPVEAQKLLLSRLHPSAHRLRIQHLGHNFKSQHRENFEITEKSGTNHS